VVARQPERHYRFCRIFFARLGGLTSLLLPRMAPSPQRQIGALIDVPRATEPTTATAAGWMFEAGRDRTRACALREALELIGAGGRPAATSERFRAGPSRSGTWAAAKLNISPAFKLEERRVDELRATNAARSSPGSDAVLASSAFTGIPERCA